jgi:hypothetical protein
VGGKSIAGRNRPTGKRSRNTYQPLLYGPGPKRNFSKRDAELEFVNCLRDADYRATGYLPAASARRSSAHRRPGPFARMAQACLDLAGAPHADAVALINELNERVHAMANRKKRE